MIITSNGNKRYVTYLDSKEEFDKHLIYTDLSSRGSINKPKIAWWGSPVDAEYGWKEWCENNEYEFNFDNPIYWTMKEGSKIYTIDFIDTESDPDNQLSQYIVDDGFGSCYLDYQRMKDDGIDAVELYNAAIGHLFISRIETMFNSWDCESIVVLNPDVIEFELHK